jgi:hypothetical protein
MDKVTLKFRLRPEYHDRAPKMSVTLNEDVLFDEQVIEARDFEQDLEIADESTYKLRFNLYDKQEQDTVVDQDGNIVKDQTINITGIKFDDIEIDSILPWKIDWFYYSHDGTRTPFYDTMGRNGSSVITFKTPLYDWLLENL